MTTGKERAILREAKINAENEDKYASVPFSATPTRQVLRWLGRQQAKGAEQMARREARKRRPKHG